MSWDCCTPDGQCQQGPGCPAGIGCHGLPGCKDTACPGRPDGGRVACASKRPSVHRVMLDGGPAKAATPRPLLHIAKRVTQLAAVAALVLIWALVTETADGAPDCSQGGMKCTSWESQA